MHVSRRLRTLSDGGGGDTRRYGAEKRSDPWSEYDAWQRRALVLRTGASERLTGARDLLHELQQKGLQTTMETFCDILCWWCRT